MMISSMSFYTHTTEATWHSITFCFSVMCQSIFPLLPLNSPILYKHISSVWATQCLSSLQSIISLAPLLLFMNTGAQRWLPSFPPSILSILGDVNLCIDNSFMPASHLSPHSHDFVFHLTPASHSTHTLFLLLILLRYS